MGRRAPVRRHATVHGGDAGDCNARAKARPFEAVCGIVAIAEERFRHTSNRLRIEWARPQGCRSENDVGRAQHQHARRACNGAQSWRSTRDPCCRRSVVARRRAVMGRIRLNSASARLTRSIVTPRGCEATRVPADTPCRSGRRLFRPHDCRSLSLARGRQQRGDRGMGGSAERAHFLVPGLDSRARAAARASANCGTTSDTGCPRRKATTTSSRRTTACRIRRSSTGRGPSTRSPRR
jgi:hypothetical protein